MTEILPNFEKKVDEINCYFNLVIFLDDKQHIADFRITGELQATLKANCYLLLYNLVEGSIVEGLDAIFVDINNQNIFFDQLNDNYKKMWLEYKHQLVKLSENKGDEKSKEAFNESLSEILHGLAIFRILDYKDRSETIFTNYKSYLKVLDSPDFSGNLDAKKIRKIAEDYGFMVPQKCDELLEIKNFRNQLAHGERTFSEVGRKRTATDLVKTKDNVIRYLQAILNNIDRFIKDKSYLNDIYRNVSK